jgi:hypothetical protein
MKLKLKISIMEKKINLLDAQRICFILLLIAIVIFFRGCNPELQIS